MTDEQSYLMLVMDEGHFVLAKACESKEEGMRKSRKYDRGGNEVSLIPCDEFEGFDKDI